MLHAILTSNFMHAIWVSCSAAIFCNLIACTVWTSELKMHNNKIQPVQYSFQLIAHAGNFSLSGKVRLKGAPIFLGMVNRLLVDVFFFSFIARSSSFWKKAFTFALRNVSGRFVRNFDLPWLSVSSSSLSSLDISWLSISLLHLTLDDSGRLHFSNDAARSLRFWKIMVSSNDYKILAGSCTLLYIAILHNICTGTYPWNAFLLSSPFVPLHSNAPPPPGFFFSTCPVVPLSCIWKDTHKLVTITLRMISYQMKYCSSLNCNYTCHGRWTEVWMNGSDFLHKSFQGFLILGSF